ncbi:MAG: MmgE/PrpD family protein [Candidatus Omnitrophica bacterium]|nr:MmgE/PrpD family protein [Candidatus Omnitrophota bacterium]
MSNIAEQMAAYAEQLKFEHLKPETVKEVKRRLLDSIACSLGANGNTPPEIAKRIAGAVNCEPGSNVIGTGHASSPDMAAFANGTQFRYLDYNDTYLSLEPCHPSDNFAATLAIATWKSIGGKEFITASALAYEILCRLCDAKSIRLNNWDHVTYGNFSAALGASKLLGLNAEAMVHALGLVGTPNNALRQTRVGELSMWKGCAFANASRAGVFAAMLAAEGMTGPAPIFEGEKGFFDRVSGPFDLTLPGPGESPDMILGTYIKFWPAEYHSQTAIEIVLNKREEIGPAENIEEILIESFDAAVDIIGEEEEKWNPHSRETADHSMPYLVAVALMDGKVDLDSFTPERIADPELRALVHKVKIVRNDELSAKYPDGIPNIVTVTTKDGKKVSDRLDYAHGHPNNPLADEEIVEKLKRLGGPYLSEERMDSISEFVFDLENQQNLKTLAEMCVWS